MVWTLIVLVLHMPSVTATAPLAERVDDAAAARLGGDVLHPGLGLLVLSFIAVLNIYKPRGLTGYGQRASHGGCGQLKNAGNGEPVTPSTSKTVLPPLTPLSSNRPIIGTRARENGVAGGRPSGSDHSSVDHGLGTR
jgi:hypothetical protein